MPTPEDFYAYMPSHRYLFVPTQELWPASSVNGRVASPSKNISPSRWLDENRAIEQMTWSPADPQIIKDRVIQRSGWVEAPGCTVFNQYRPADLKQGNPYHAMMWVDHVRRIYPSDVEHMLDCFAFKVQNPGLKINHALLLGGSQGIGKDAILHPIIEAVGAWNFRDVNPSQMMGRFNGWAKAVIVRVNEVRDLGGADRYAFYEHSKQYIVSPPEAQLIDEKNVPETYVPNVIFVILTTNHKASGIYLPDDDRRTYVAWSSVSQEELGADYFSRLWGFYRDGGCADVAAYLLARDLSHFDAGAPPPKTPAFYEIAHASEDPGGSELDDVLDSFQPGSRPDAVTAAMVVARARAMGLDDLANELEDRKARRSLPRKFERAGYVPIRNPDAKDGLFVAVGRRVAVYARECIDPAARTRAAQSVVGKG